MPCRPLFLLYPQHPQNYVQRMFRSGGHHNGRQPLWFLHQLCFRAVEPVHELDHQAGQVAEVRRQVGGTGNAHVNGAIAAGLVILPRCPFRAA